MRREFKKKSKVLLIDDNYEHLVGIRELLNLEGTFDVVGDTSTNYPDKPGKHGSASWGGVSYDHYPDFGKDDIEKCIAEYNSRHRRFGGLDPEDMESEDEKH